MRRDTRLARLGRGVMAAAGAVLMACSGAVSAGPVTAVSTADARGWLLRIQNAAVQRNYQGTLVVTAGGGMSSSRVAHYCAGDQVFERIDMLDGRVRRVYRHNDQVLTVWPATKVAHAEQRDAVASFPAVVSGSVEQLFDRYDMIREGADRVAGHEAAVFLLRPRDGLRFAQRLWAERESGLLLRADVLAADGSVLETAAFTDIAIGVRPQPDSVLVPMKKLDGYRMAHSTPQRAALDAEGWQFKSPVPGFKQISCVKRNLEAPGDGDRNAATVLQTIFSDGLTNVSVFIEPLHAARHRSGGAAFGATHTLRQAHGLYGITVIGDVPMATLKLFSAALERMR